MFGCYIYMYIVSDQGIFQLGAKLYAEESFLLGMITLQYSVMLMKNDQWYISIFFSLK